MGDNKLPLYCAHNGVVAMATRRYDRNSTSSGKSYKVFNGKLNLLLAWLRVTDRRSKNIDYLPVLGTCQSVTSAMLSSEFNGPIAHGSTQ